MAVQKIDYQNKVRGDLFTSANANEIKAVVNNNADEVTALASSVTSVSQSVTSLSQAITDIRENSGAAVVQQTQQTASISPNVLNVWGSVTQLTITLTAGSNGIANEYMMEFTVSGDNFSLTLPSNVRWAEEPEWESGYTYQVSIVNRLAIYAGWEAASS